jgi:hypothetical protein
VYNTVVKLEMQDIMPVAAGDPIACQANTSTRHDFADKLARHCVQHLYLMCWHLELMLLNLGT